MILKKKIFEYFSMYFYGLNLRPLTRGHLGPWDLHLNKLGRGPLGNATYQISNIWAKWFWRRRFLNIFLWFEPRTPCHGAILDPGTLVWTNLVKDHQAMLHTKFQAPVPCSSGEEDFEVYFIFEPKTCPPQGHFGPQGHHSNKLGRGPLGNATYQISRP